MGEISIRETRRVIVLGTGGTISGRAGAVGDNIGYTALLVERGADVNVANPLLGTPLHVVPGPETRPWCSCLLSAGRA